MMNDLVKRLLDRSNGGYQGDDSALIGSLCLEAANEIVALREMIAIAEFNARPRSNAGDTAMAAALSGRFDLVAWNIWNEACACRDARWKDALHFYDGDIPRVAFDLAKIRAMFT
jgi:hypothetical protein